MLILKKEMGTYMATLTSLYFPLHLLSDNFMSHHTPHSFFLFNPVSPLPFATYQPSVCVCVLFCVCEGRCLPAGCQVTSLIERPLESSCYQKSLNLFFRLPLEFLLLFSPSRSFPVFLPH